MNFDLDKSSWRRVRFGDVVSRSREQTKPSREGINRYVAGGHFNKGELTLDRYGDMDDGGMGSTFTYLFRPGQILFVSARPYLRNIAVPDFTGVVADKTYVLDARPEQGLLQRFLPWVLLSQPFFDYSVEHATGSMNPRLLWSAMQAYEFDLPPLDEQQRIADLLWIAERAHRDAMDLVAAAEGLERGYLASVLASDELHRPIDDLLVRTIGGVWGEEPGVGDVDVRVIRGTDLDDFGRPDFDTSPVRSISASELAGRKLRHGDVLLEKSGGSPQQPVGKVGLVDRDPELSSVTSNFVQLLRPDEGIVISEYVFLVLRGMWLTGRFAPITGKTTNISNLRTRELFPIKVPVPSLEVQRELVRKWRAASDARTLARDVADSDRLLVREIQSMIWEGK